MSKSAAPAFKATDLELHLAGLFYPILLQLAKDKAVMTYKELIQKTQELNPQDTAIMKMIPVRSGKVLGVIYHFAQTNGLPRITTLIVNKSGECGAGILISHDCAAERELCYAFDWSAEQPKFWDLLAQAKAANATKRIRKIRLTLDKALNIAWPYWIKNQTQLTQDARNAIEKIAKSLCTGISVEEAFAPYKKA